MTHWLDRAAAFLLRVAVHLYRGAIKPWLRPACRFEPSCSTYALEALTTHGAGGGGWLAVRRLARCHPWGGWGWDPVPPAGSDLRRLPFADHPRF